MSKSIKKFKQMNKTEKLEHLNRLLYTAHLSLEDQRSIVSEIIKIEGENRFKANFI